MAGNRRTSWFKRVSTLLPPALVTHDGRQPSSASMVQSDREDVVIEGTITVASDQVHKVNLDQMFKCAA